MKRNIKLLVVSLLTLTVAVSCGRSRNDGTEKDNNTQQNTNISTSQGHTMGIPLESTPLIESLASQTPEPTEVAEDTQEKNNDVKTNHNDKKITVSEKTKKEIKELATHVETWNETKQEIIEKRIRSLKNALAAYKNLDSENYEDNVPSFEGFVWDPPILGGLITPATYKMKFLEEVILSVGRDISNKLELFMSYFIHEGFEEKKIEIMKNLIESIKFHIVYLDNIGKKEFEINWTEIFLGTAIDLGNLPERQDILEKVISEKLERLDWHLSNKELLMDPWTLDEIKKSLEERIAQKEERIAQEKEDAQLKAIPSWKILDYVLSKKSEEEQEAFYKRIDEIVQKVKEQKLIQRN